MPLIFACFFLSNIWTFSSALQKKFQNVGFETMSSRIESNGSEVQGTSRATTWGGCGRGGFPSDYDLEGNASTA